MLVVFGFAFAVFACFSVACCLCCLSLACCDVVLLCVCLSVKRIVDMFHARIDADF